MSDEHEGISISRYLKKPDWLIELEKQNPLSGGDRLDARLRDELVHSRLPQPLHEAFITELWKAKEEESQSQSLIAQNPRGDKTLSDAIRKLAATEGSAKELWPALFGYLDRAMAVPELDESDADMRKWSMSYATEKSAQRAITFGTFQNRLTKARQGQKSR
jgi:hypothetical protein